MIDRSKIKKFIAKHFPTFSKEWGEGSDHTCLMPLLYLMTCWAVGGRIGIGLYYYYDLGPTIAKRFGYPPEPLMQLFQLIGTVLIVLFLYYHERVRLRVFWFLKGGASNSPKNQNVDAG